MKNTLLVLALLAPSFAAAQQSEQQKLEALQARFAPVDLTADASKLSEGDKKALAKLVDAAKIMDALFLRQDWAGSEAMLLELLKDDSSLGRARLRFFLTMKGPWDRT